MKMSLYTVDPATGKLVCYKLPTEDFNIHSESDVKEALEYARDDMSHHVALIRIDCQPKKEKKAA